MTTPIVDIHCHTFNADDLPVRGFVQKVAFHDHALTDNVARLVDHIIQGAAPGYREEKRRLDELLAPTGGPEAVRPPLTTEQLEAEVDLAVADLMQSSPELLRQVGYDVGGVPVPDPAVAGETPEGLFDWVSAARRAVRWAKLFGKQRLDLTVALLSNFDNRIDLYTPLTVDLGMGLEDTAKTTIREQLELHEKISRLSMMDRLPGGVRGQVHGFVGFDPRRELRARRTDDIELPLAVVRSAIEDYGMVGVKLYPPMGFRPFGNVDHPAVPDGAELDGILGELYAWCVAADVPITAHCNTSNHAHESFKDFASPDYWSLAFDAFPELRVNMGHFGGARTSEPPDGWPWKAAALTARHPHAYADVGNHKIHDDDIRTDYFTMLATMYSAPPTAAMAGRLMFGSDWYMLASQQDHDEFLDRYEESYRAEFGDELTNAFLGTNALRFLGFDDPENQNNQRLRARYRRFAPDNVPSWLAST